MAVKETALTEAEQELLTSGCLYLQGEVEDEMCPAVVAKTSPYTYQKYGCRGIACREVNSRYYTEHWKKQQKAKTNGHKKTAKRRSR